MTTTLTKKPRGACRLVDQDAIKFELLAPADGQEPQVAREWRMLAHTGQIVSRWWGRLVLDMDGASFRQKLALLKDHDTSQPIGYSTSIERTKRGIEAAGKLVSSEIADEVLKLSREGFPWQASLMAVPSVTEEVLAGATATVNGREVQGPLTIFRKWEMHELTLTVLGADSNTTTEAFGADGAVEFQMTTKSKDAPATEPADLTAQVPAPQPVAPATNPAPATPAPDLAKLERERASAILKAAEPEQAKLAQELVEQGVTLAQALERLNADLRERLKVAQQGLRIAAEPIGSGNTAKHIDAQRSGVNFAALEASPHRPEELKREYSQNEKLRGYFQDEATFLAWHKHHGRALHLGNDRNVELLAGGLSVMGYRNVQGRYFLGYDRGASDWARRVSEQMMSDQPLELHKWLGAVASPTKFAGERKRNSLTDYGLQILSEKYELTVDADIDDVRRDKTGQVLRRISEMGAKMASLDERLLSTMLESTVTCYDGVALWSASHKVGKTGTTQSNDITVSGLSTPDAPTSAGMSGAILAGVKQLVGMLDDQGDPMNQGAKRFLLVTPLKYWDPTIAALQNQYTSAGVNNTLLNAGITITPVTNVRLSGAASAAGRRIYLMREDADVLPFITQDEAIPDAFKSQDAYSESGFWQEKLAWGAKRITTVAPGRFELAVRVNLAA